MINKTNTPPTLYIHIEILHLMPDPPKNELVKYVAGPQLYINQSLAQPD